MTAAEVIEAGWPVVVAYHAANAGRYPCNAHVRDLLWDAAVDVLLSVSRTFDGAGRPPGYLANYLRWAIRRHWRRLVFRRKPLERQMVQWGLDEFGRPIDCPGLDAGQDLGRGPLARQGRGRDFDRYDRGQDVVDGADLVGLLARLPAPQRAALEANLAGETWTQIAERAGTYHRLEFERGKAAVRKLRELVGEGGSCVGH
jgi:hypothetical protein